ERHLNVAEGQTLLRPVVRQRRKDIRDAPAVAVRRRLAVAVSHLGNLLEQLQDSDHRRASPGSSVAVDHCSAKSRGRAWGSGPSVFACILVRAPEIMTADI